MAPLARLVAAARAHLLSEGELGELLPGIRIWTYPELADMRTIDDALDAEGRCVLHFPMESATVGHWCALWLRPDGHITFFDPYGMPADAQRAHSLAPAQLGMAYPLLRLLIARSGRMLHSSAMPLQSERRGVASCGAHCVVRLWHKRLTDAAYARWLARQLASLSPAELRAVGDADGAVALMCLLALSPPG